MLLDNVVGCAGHKDGLRLEDATQHEVAPCPGAHTIGSWRCTMCFDINMMAQYSLNGMNFSSSITCSIDTSSWVGFMNNIKLPILLF